MKSLNEIKNMPSADKYKVLIIPAELIDIIKEKLGDEFVWDYDKKTNQLFVMQRPESYTDFLTGLGKEMWDSVGGTEYIRRERDQWDD